jgi:hypothetical protein
MFKFNRQSHVLKVAMAMNRGKGEGGGASGYVEDTVNPHSRCLDVCGNAS